MPQSRSVSRADIAGVWRRVFLVDGDGVEDRESAVFWIQATRLCGDVRQHRRRTLLVDADPTEPLPLLDAFAGELVEGRTTFIWRPALRLREREGPPDEGRLSWDGADLREDGVHRRYVEGWTRVASAVRGDYAASLLQPDTGRRAHVLRIGRFLFHARDHAAAAPDFTLFERGEAAPRVVLSTLAAEEARVPFIEFADSTRRSVWISHALGDVGPAPERWLVTALDDCVAAGC